MIKRFSNLSYIYVFWIFLFIVFPITLVLYYAFSEGNIGSFETTSLSVQYFYKFFTSRYFYVLLDSIGQAFLCTVFCFIVGYPTAFFLYRMEKKKADILLLLIILPMWMNFLVRTYAWVNLLSKNGLINSVLVTMGFEPIKMLYTKGSILLGMVYNFIPFMILPIYNVMEKIDKSYIEAAKDLGANDFKTFKKVIFPMSIPGIITGITMVLIPAISTFEISALLGGNKYNLIGNIVEHQFKVAGNWHYGSAISVVLMVIILIAMFVTDKEGD